MHLGANTIVKKRKTIWNKRSNLFLFDSQSSIEDPRRAREQRWPSLDCVSSEWALFMRLPVCHPHITMNCEQDFGDGGLGVTLTLRLLMHGKVQALTHIVNKLRDGSCSSFLLTSWIHFFCFKYVFTVCNYLLSFYPILGGWQHHRKGENSWLFLLLHMSKNYIFLNASHHDQYSAFFWWAE